MDGRVLEAFDQKTRVAVRRKTVGALQFIQASFARPVTGKIPHQAGRIVAIRQHLEKTEGAGFPALVAVARQVDRSTNRADDFPTVFGQPEVAFTIAEEGGFLVQVFLALRPEWRHPVRVMTVDVEAKLVKSLFIAFRQNGENTNRHKTLFPYKG